jgi:hypothetical protein
MVSTPRNVVSPEHGVSTPMLRASPEHGLRIISFITGLTNNAVPSRSIATPQHHVVISILPHSMVSTPRDVVSPEHGLSTHVTLLVQSMVSAPLVRASPGAWSQNRLWSFQSNSFECMRYGSASDVWMRQLEQCRPITEVEGQSIGNETNEQCRSFTHVPSAMSTSLARSMV